LRGAAIKPRSLDYATQPRLTTARKKKLGLSAWDDINPLGYLNWSADVHQRREKVELAVGYGDDKFEGRMRRAEAGDFDVGEPRAESCTAHVVLGDGLLAFGVNDPESGGVFEGAGSGFDLGEIGKRIGDEEDPRGRGGLSSCGQGAVVLELNEKVRWEGTKERDRIAGLDAEFIEKRFGIGDAFAPFFGFGAEIEDIECVLCADAQLPFPSFHFLD
jgi:hypothetical protein